jgi:monoamine oxidase
MYIVIVGGGISGLYLGIELIKRRHNVTIIESTKRLGGRIYTKHFMGYTYESGAGRFSNNHKLLLELISRYNLGDPIKIGGYSKTLGHYYKSIEDKLKRNRNTADLSKISTFEYLVELFGEVEANKFKLLYGYDGDLLLSSALCGTNILMDDYKSTQYYVLRDGLDKLIEHMAMEYTSKGGKIVLDQRIDTIDKGADYYKVSGPNLSIKCNKLVLAIPPSAIQKLYPNNPKTFSFIKYIKAVPLLRIYFLYNKPQSALKGLHKFVSDLDIRFIIPINEQIVMISYSDYKLADKWKTLYENNLEEFYRKILMEFKIVTGKVLSKPDDISFEYWSRGVYVWGPKYNYLENYSKIIQPLDGLYLSNEAYSKKQGWLEGSLEMAKDVSLFF